MNGRPTRPYSGVQTVERAFAVLEVLADSRGPMGISTVAQQTSLPEPTVHRLLRTLASHGYVRQSPDSHKYFLGWRLLNLGEAATRSFRMWAQPHLAELADVSGETANLTVLEGSHVVYVAQAPSRHKVRMFTEVGNRVLPHSTAAGKVLLAYRPRDVAAGIIDRNGLPERTPNTITDPDEFYAELDRVTQQGFAVDNQEEEFGVRCMAVPLFGTGDSVAAISVSGPAGRLDRADRERFLPEMLRIAANVSRSWLGRAVEV